METQAQIPLLQPVNISVPAGTTRTISFPDEFLGRAVAIIITNLDAANVSTYRINGDTRQTMTLATNSFRAIDSTLINLITITAGAADATQIEAQVQLLVK